MKQLMCEMCCSTDMLKQDGVFVCQACGCKYSVEEAKRMMIEGTVDVQGTVKVDDSAKIANYYVLAENAYEVDNTQEAVNYCNKIIEIDATNYKAWLLKGNVVGWESSIDNIRIEEAGTFYKKAIDNAPEEEMEAVKEEIAEEIYSLSTDLVQLCCENFEQYPSNGNRDSIFNVLDEVEEWTVYLLGECGANKTEYYNEVARMMSRATSNAWNNVICNHYQSERFPSWYVCEEYKKRCVACQSILMKAIDLSEDKKDNIQRYKNLIFLSTKLIYSHWYKSFDNGNYREFQLKDEEKTLYLDNIMRYHAKIKELDPSYEIPPRPVVKSASGGCYVATAVYGSYDCPQVWTLRRYRDDRLARTWYGRAFIRTYYAISPTLVKWFGHTQWFKKMWKGKLDRMVANLNAEGVENTPYQDKAW